MAVQTSASIFIKGYNQMTKAVNGAIADINKIKASADKASKTLRNVFELGTTVAVLKKVVKLSKEYMQNMTDEKVLSSFNKLKQTTGEIGNTFKSTLNTILPSFFESVNTFIEKIKDKIETGIYIVGAVLTNLPKVFELTVGLLGDMLQTVWSWDFIKATVINVFQNIATLIEGVWNAANDATGGKIKSLMYEIASDFWQILSDAGSAIENLIENTVNPIINTINKLLHTDIDEISVSIGNGYAYKKSKELYSLSLQAKKSVDLKAAVKDVADSLESVTTNTINYLKEQFGEDFSEYSEEIKKIVDELKEKVKENTDAVKNTKASTGFGSGIVDVFAKIKNFIKNLSPVVILIRLIATAVERFLSVLGNGIDTVLQPLFDIFAWAGQIAAEQFMPILDRLYPIIQMGAVMIEELTNAVATHLAPIIEFVAAVLEILSPVLTLITKAFIILMAPAQWLADAFKWLAEWIKYLGNAISTAIYNIFHPLNQRSVTASKPGSFSSDAFSGLSDRLARVDALGSTTAGLTNGTSTSSAISSASYNGATSVTINIYQQAAVVGDSGMRQFAQMIRNEFEKLDYYGVTV